MKKILNILVLVSMALSMSVSTGLARSTDDAAQSIRYSSSELSNQSLIPAAPNPIKAVIVVTKVANPIQIQEPGGDITFTVVIVNTGGAAIPVTINSLVDNIHGDLNGQGTCSVPQVIPYGGSYDCQFTAPVTGNAGYSETDIVTATGVDAYGYTVSDYDDAIVTITPVDPEIDVVKTADPITVTEPGGEVTFTVDVTNLSNPTDPVTITSLVDDPHGDLNGQGTCAVPFTLQPGETYTCQFTALVEGNAGYVEIDTVTASGADDEGTPVSDFDDATVSVVEVLPTVDLIKDVTPSTLPEPGGEFVYTLTIHNTSPEEVTITSLVDDNSLSEECTDLIGVVLPVDGSVSCQYTVTQTEAGEYLNTATVIVADDDGNTATDTDTETVTVTDVLPTVDLIKDVTPSTLPEPGGEFVYTLTIHNTSPEEVTITSLVDDNPLPEECTDLIGVVLPVDGSVSCQYTVTQTEVGSYPNIASVIVQDDDGNSASDTDDETVTVTNLTPEIEVIKTADPEIVAEPGGVVTFTVEVTNLSNPSDPVTITSLVDEPYGDLTLIEGSTCEVPFTLQPGETYTCQFTALVEGDAGDIETDVVTASGTDDEDTPVSDSDDATVTVVTDDGLPEIEVVKTADPTFLPEPGGMVTFTVEVTNLSNPTDPVTIESLVDDIHGDLDGQGTCSVPQVIQPGDTYSCEFTALVEGEAGDSETDTVTASGRDDEGFPVSDSDDATVVIESSTALYKVYFPSAERVNILSNAVPLTLGFEDLDFDRPDMDFDYNDWVTNIDTRLVADAEEQNLYRINFNITPRARGGVRTHSFHILIPADTFSSNGTATLTIRDGEGNVVSSVQTPYISSQASDFVVIPCTCDAFPVAGEIINAKEGTPQVETQRTAELSIDFFSPAPFDPEYISESKLGEPHGTGLFFDPYLEVLDKSIEIHQGDLRMLSIPTVNWMWPEERVQIDQAYPGVTGPAPDFTFPDGWWLNHNTCVYGDGIKCPSAIYSQYLDAE